MLFNNNNNTTTNKEYEYTFFIYHGLCLYFNWDYIIICLFLHSFLQSSSLLNVNNTAKGKRITPWHKTYSIQSYTHQCVCKVQSNYDSINKSRLN